MDSKLDTKRLRYFYTIVEQGSFRKAAEVLNISQPPLSQRLKELEIALDTELIKRDTRNIELTEAGKFVYEKAKQLFAILDEIPHGVNKIKSNIKKTFNIGVSSTCASHLTHYIPHILLEFPDIYMSVVTGDSTYLESMLQTQKIDIALLQLPRKLDPQYLVHLLRPAELVAILPKSYPILQEMISFESLAKIPLALMKRVSGFGTYDVLMHLFQQKSLTPRVIMDSAEVQTILSFMQTNSGVASILPRSELPIDIDKNYRIMPLEQADFVMQPCLIYLKEKADIPILKRLTDLIMQTQSRVQSSL